MCATYNFFLLSNHLLLSISCSNKGLSPEHGRKEMVRAVLESISFSVKAIVERAEEQIDYAKLTKEIRYSKNSNEYSV